MSETVVTQVTAVSTNEVSDTAKEQLLSNREYDSFEEYVESLEADVEAIISNRVFGDADEIPIMNVTTDIE